MKNRFWSALSALCVALMVGNLAAQETGLGGARLGLDVKNKRIGSAAATELLIPVGARDLALGGASISTSKGIEALHWNPAGLGHLATAAEALVSSMSYIGDIRVNYAAVGVSFSGFGVVAVSVKSLDFGSIPLTTNDDPEGKAGRTFAPTFLTAGLSYSRAFTDAITAGGTIKIISEKIGRVSGSGIAFDLGVQYHSVAGIAGLHAGVTMKNYGSQVAFDGPGLFRKAIVGEGQRPEQFYKVEGASFELPSSVELGLTYERSINENLSWNVNSAFANNNFGLDGYRLGGELAYILGQTRLFGRAGIEMSPEGPDDEQIFGPAAGFGLNYAAAGIDFSIDYAYRQADFFDDNSLFSLKFGF